MTRIVVIGGTGYAGAAIVAEAASRGHEVTAFSRSLPEHQVEGVNYVQGDATDEQALAAVIVGQNVVVGALAPRGPLTSKFREINRTIARLADAEHARLFIVGGHSSLRPAAGAARYIENPDMFPEDAPAELKAEVIAGAELVMEDLPATPESFDWVFVSPAQTFGAWAPGENLGRYRLGDEVDVAAADKGGAISAPDYAIGFVDLIEQNKHHRAQVNLAH